MLVSSPARSSGRPDSQTTARSACDASAVPPINPGCPHAWAEARSARVGVLRCWNPSTGEKRNASSPNPRWPHTRPSGITAVAYEAREASLRIPSEAEKVATNVSPEVASVKDPTTVPSRQRPTTERWPPVTSPKTLKNLLVARGDITINCSFILLETTWPDGQSWMGAGSHTDP